MNVYSAFRQKIASKSHVCMAAGAVTEREVRRAIRDRCPTAAERHCLAYIRHIDDVNLSDVRAVRNFVDMTSENDVDVEAERLMSALRDDLLPTLLSTTNVQRFTVHWKSPSGLDVFSHDDYLNNFCSTFFSSVLAAFAFAFTILHCCYSSSTLTMLHRWISSPFNSQSHSLPPVHFGVLVR